MDLNLLITKESSRHISHFRKSEATTNQTISHSSDKNNNVIKSYFDSGHESLNPKTSPNDEYSHFCDNQQFQYVLSRNSQHKNFYSSDEEQ